MVIFLRGGVETTNVSTKTLSVNESIEFNGAKVNGAIYGLWELEMIPSNSDLNDYITPGMYAIKSNSIAGTISNLPEQLSGKAGRLIVYSATGKKGMLLSGAYDYIMQEYMPRLPNFPYFKRLISTDVNKNITYGLWYPASGTDYIVEQGTSGNWTYRKWYSGIAECWYKGNVTFPSTTTGSGVENIYLNYVDISFPFTFTSNPMATCSVAWRYGEWVQCHAGTTTVRIRKFANTNGTNSTTNDVSIDVKGRWK